MNARGQWRVCQKCKAAAAAGVGGAPAWAAGLGATPVSYQGKWYARVGGDVLVYEAGVGQRPGIYEAERLNDVYGGTGVGRTGMGDAALDGRDLTLLDATQTLIIDMQSGTVTTAQNNDVQNWQGAYNASSLGAQFGQLTTDGKYGPKSAAALQHVFDYTFPDGTQIGGTAPAGLNFTPSPAPQPAPSPGPAPAPGPVVVAGTASAGMSTGAKLAIAAAAALGAAAVARSLYAKKHHQKYFAFAH